MRLSCQCTLAARVVLYLAPRQLSYILVRYFPSCEVYIPIVTKIAQWVILSSVIHAADTVDQNTAPVRIPEADVHSIDSEISALIDAIQNRPVPFDVSAVHYIPSESQETQIPRLTAIEKGGYHQQRHN